ncbi:MAG TPA: type II toxin-antitoxin system HicB family antitoxin [Candidatus Ozemobacteraceae bacterium]|nr:type II toxin-antitoxin system HicB family antitoxin [Candidatus Ozemobacteraceae bacterium]
MLNYKGYIGVVEFDDEANIFHGEVIGIRDVITFQGQTVDEIREALKDSVDDYIDMCRKHGKEPEKPFSGKLVLRLESELHRRVACAALREGKSINKWIADTLKDKAA